MDKLDWKNFKTLPCLIFLATFPSGRAYYSPRPLKPDFKMKTKTNLTILALAFFTGCALRAEQDMINKSFPVKSGGKLLMDVDRGSIHVTTSDSDKVEVQVTREVRRTSARKAKDIIAQHKIDVSESGNDVRIEAKNHGGAFNKIFNNLQVDYTIAIPAKFNVDLRTAGGNIDLADLEGKVDLHTSGGNLKLGSIDGPINAHTSGGNINVKAGRGEASVHTSGGSIHMGKMNGSLKAETSGGDVHIKEAYGPVRAQTSGGNVSAELFEQPKSTCSLKTSGGNVDVKLADNLALDVNAHTSGGSIHSDFPGTMNKQKTALTAQLNGGGTDLVLQTSGGNVSIRRK
jgi:DUF4097 and DUF4098 domain-containing protein YvlB